MVRNEALVLGRRKQRCRTASDLGDLVTRCRVDLLELEESQRAVWAALRGLPPEQAEVVVLKIWEQMTFAQIAQTLEISPNTAASRYQYAMAKLTERLAKRQPEVAYDL
jgi:RNA polymerase sigma-70 factor (ECF subfamily)